MKFTTLTILTTVSFLFLTSANAQVNWVVTDRILQQEDTVQIRFKTHGFSGITAYQFALRYDLEKLELIGLGLPDPNGIPMSDISSSFFTDLEDTLYFPECIRGDFGFCTPGEVRTVWTNPYPQSCENNTTIFILHFKVKVSDTLSNVLTLAPDILPNQAWMYTGLPFPLANSPVGLNFYYTELPLPLSPIEELNTSIRIYPNPCIDYMYVDSLEPVDVIVVNQMGQIIFNDRIYSRDSGIFLDKGINYIKLIGSNSTIVKQVLKH